TIDKVFKIVDPSEPRTSTSTQCLPSDWSKCIICQTDTKDKLVCPSDATLSRIVAGYKTIVDNLAAFDKIGYLPRTLNLAQLDEGHGIEASFRLHNAKWHDSCRLQYNKTELKRAEKREKYSTKTIQYPQSSHAKAV
ncbi:hypothetical protein ScPMuIL_009917, partial [Solemya velum]